MRPTVAEAKACAATSAGSMHCLVKEHAAFAEGLLSYLALPGAENSGTFNLDAQAFDTQACSPCTTFSEGNTVSEATAQRFSATQDQTISRQLNEGVRWIDLQVGDDGGGNPMTGWRVGLVVGQGLWANFAAKHAEGAGPGTIAEVAARPRPPGAHWRPRR